LSDRNLPSYEPTSTIPGSSVSLTVTLGSSRLGAASSSPRSASAPWDTRPLKSIWLPPELFTTSGGSPATNRGCNVSEICWVAECLIWDLG
jgi:hypothetical protein